MGRDDPITHFHFSFSSENRKSALFSLVFLPGIIPLKPSKTKLEKVNFYRVFSLCFWHFRGFSGLGQTNPPEKPSSAGGQNAYLPGPLIKAHTSALSVSKATTKPPHLETFSTFLRDGTR